MAFKLLLAAAGLAHVYAQATPKPCSYPAAFTATVHSFYYMKNAVSRGQVVYDAANSRAFEQQSWEYEGQRGSAQHITLFKEGREYRIDTTSEPATCTYGPIPTNRAFSKFAVSTTATFHSQVTEGVYPTTILINEFSSVHSARNVSTDIYTHVTANECMPTSIREFHRDAKTGFPDIDNSMVRDFFDAVLGVADPNVFIPPADCKARPPPGPSPPHTVCTPKLKSLCGPTEHKGATCTACVARNANALRTAGCTAAVEAAFCKAPPHTACTPALDKACGKTEHTGKDCTTCCAANKAVLLKAGCTAAAERAFCAVPV